MRETYEKLCELFGVEPEESEFNSDWLDHYAELIEREWFHE